jgi:hypothetical protein
MREAPVSIVFADQKSRRRGAPAVPVFLLIVRSGPPASRRAPAAPGSSPANPRRRPRAWLLPSLTFSPSPTPTWPGQHTRRARSAGRWRRRVAMDVQAEAMRALKPSGVKVGVYAAMRP